MLSRHTNLLCAQHEKGYYNDHDRQSADGRRQSYDVEAFICGSIGPKGLKTISGGSRNLEVPGVTFVKQIALKARRYTYVRISFSW